MSKQKYVFNSGQELIIYISMAFGNIYNDKYSTDNSFYYIEKLINIGIKKITLADNCYCG